MRAQISGSNQAVWQVGNLPEKKPANRSNLYNQLNMLAVSDAFQLGMRAEIYSVDDSRRYARITQRFIRYAQNGLTLTAGNFYTMLGRGALLRGYDVPGVVYEDTGTRQRYGFYKDIDGLQLLYRKGDWDINALYGRPLNLVIPPAYGQTQRRSNLIQGGQARYRFNDGLQTGLLYLRSDAQHIIREYGGASVEGAGPFFDYYAEYSQQSGRPPFDNNTPHALYGALNVYGEALALSLEYKRYKQYTMGFNEPPPLVKEHSFTLLNRATHSIEPSDETGYQAELLWNIGAFNTVTLNASRAVNRFSSFKAVFYEYYADLQYYLTDEWLGKLFADVSQDELVGETERYTAGMQLEGPLTPRWGIVLEAEAQRLKRLFSSVEVIGNQLLALSFTSAPDFSFTLVVEHSNDPVEITGNGEDVFWPALTINYQVDGHNTLDLFYGKRRGGNACTGGICYRVLPFEGLEVQWSTRF